MAATYSALNHKTCQPVLEPVAASSLAQRRSMKKLTSTDMLWTEASSHHCVLSSPLCLFIWLLLSSLFGVFPQFLHIVIGHQTLSNWTLLHQGGCLASYRLRDCTEHGWNLNPKCCRAAVCVFSPISTCICILWNSPILSFLSRSSFSLSLFPSELSGKPAPVPILIHCDWLT